MTLRLVSIELVKTNRQIVHPVEGLAKSIAEIGQLAPIGIDADNNLIYGLHRLEACRSLGWASILAVEVSLEGLEAELATVDENLFQSERTALERAQLIAERKRIYEALHPEAKDGAAQLSGMKKARSFPVTATVAVNETAPAFATDTAAKTGRSERSVRRDAQIGEKLDAKAAADLVGTPVADSPKRLLEIAKKDPKEQQRLAAEMKATVKAARERGMSKADQMRAMRERDAGEVGVNHAQEAQDAGAWKRIRSLSRSLHAALVDNQLADGASPFAVHEDRIERVLRAAWKAEAETDLILGTAASRAVGEALILIAKVGARLGKEFASETADRSSAKRTKKGRR